jgi:hypothetical protein
LDSLLSKGVIGSEIETRGSIKLIEGTRYHRPVISALGRYRQEDHEFKANQEYIVSSRPATGAWLAHCFDDCMSTGSAWSSELPR